tara:strand:- start:1130 stop:1636 length:507 start_codon:yes stop_codon:yes gene_type:complete
MSVYSNIINPATNKLVSIHSYQGKKIINTYIQQLGGGGACKHKSHAKCTGSCIWKRSKIMQSHCAKIAHADKINKLKKDVRRLKKNAKDEQENAILHATLQREYKQLLRDYTQCATDTDKCEQALRTHKERSLKIMHKLQTHASQISSRQSSSVDVELRPHAPTFKEL